MLQALALPLLAQASVPLPGLEKETHRGVVASLVLHVGIAVLVLRVPAPVMGSEPPNEIEIWELPPLPAPKDSSLGIAGSDRALPVHSAAAPATRAALVVAKESPTSAPSSEGDSPKSTEVGPGDVDDGRVCDDEDCVLEALNRCLAGDGSGCVEVGQYYEIRRADPFSAIKWYVKACGLASRAGCDANERIKTVMPVGWAHRRMLAPI